jgi:RNA polymerase sigma-70 factor (ECF subfamily)
MASTSESQALLVLKLFEKYYERVYCFARRSVDASTAEDMAQEVFVRLLDVPDLETRVVEVSYLLKIADNLIKRSYRRKQQFERHIHDQRRAGVCDAPQAQDPEYLKVDLQRAVKDTLHALSEREQEAVRLIVLRGLSYEEAAASLGVNTSSVNNWKFRGLQRMKHHASPREDTAGRTADGSNARPATERDQPGRARFGQRAG